MGDFFNTIKEQLHDEKGIGAGAGTNWFHPYPVRKNTIEIGFGAAELIKKFIDLENNVVGIDIGDLSHTDAISRGLDLKAKLHYLDISHDKIPLENDTIDEAYCLECIEHLESPAHMFQEVKRVLKPDGLFILAFPRPEDNLSPNCGGHMHCYPGFLLKHSFRLFCDQMYFKVMKYAENGSTAWYLLKNVKTGNEIGIHNQIRGNYEYDQLFGHLHGPETWKEENDPKYIYKTFQSINLFKNINYLDKE